MESIYFVMSWLCHRTCRHCYEDRFRPYHGEELERLVRQARINVPRIIDNLPSAITYWDRDDPLPCGGFREKTGRVILAGGEILLEPIRESVLYPALEQLASRYRDKGGVKLVVQTTGDTLTDGIISELLSRDVWMISVSGIDAYHAGLENDGARAALQDKLTRMFEARGMRPFGPAAEHTAKAADRGPHYQFFGATPGSWIGSLWPRGRAFKNELSTAGLADNFCNRWSGGLSFLDYRHNGSEVSIDPEGDVFPCCIKTRLPVGNLLEEPLEAMLDRLAGNPVYEAISMGHPERMGITAGWSVERFLEKSRRVLSSGRVYQKLCVGCDAFHEEVLMARPPELISIGRGSGDRP